MKTVLKLSMLALSIALVGCNEKVSPELEASNSTTPTPPPPTAAPEEYYFSVTNASDVLLNYKVHKTGIGNGNTACEIRNTTGMSNDLFRASQAANDITCFFEAEELSLMYGGFSFDINASKNTCDYIAYSPYGFYDRIPGDSTAQYYEVECPAATTLQAHVDLAVSPARLNIDLRDNSGVNIGCGKTVIADYHADDHPQGIVPGVRTGFDSHSDEEYCAFDYSAQNGGPNCDIGTITVNTITVNHTPATATDPEVVTQSVTPRTINCAGRVSNCLAGPITEMTSRFTSYIEYHQQTVGQVGKVNYEYDGLFADSPDEESKQTTKTYVNFRRTLASKNINFIDSLDGDYNTKWGGIYAKIFDPQVMDYYSRNYRMDGVTRQITSAQLITESKKDTMYSRVPLAADPIVGLSYNNRSYAVNPFYTFYCLDTAFDIKARIRMVVREWDRLFSTTTADLEDLSDLYKTGNARRQDTGNLVEVNNDMDNLISYNDKADPDDHIMMQRTAGVYDPMTTIWNPLPTADFPDGWFNNDPDNGIFTNGEL